MKKASCSACAAVVFAACTSVHASSLSLQFDSEGVKLGVGSRDGIFHAIPSDQLVPAGVHKASRNIQPVAASYTLGDGDGFTLADTFIGQADFVATGPSRSSLGLTEPTLTMTPQPIGGAGGELQLGNPRDSAGINVGTPGSVAKVIPLPAPLLMSLTGLVPAIVIGLRCRRAS